MSKLTMGGFGMLGTRARSGFYRERPLGQRSDMVNAIFQRKRKTPQEGWEESWVRTKGDGEGVTEGTGPAKPSPVPQGPTQNFMEATTGHHQPQTDSKSPSQASSLAFLLSAGLRML